MAELTLALRGLLRSPAHSCLVIVCLAIGLAVNIVSFSVAHAVIYGELPGITTRHTIARLSLQYEGVFGAESVNGQRVSAGPFSHVDFQTLESAPPDTLSDVAAEGRRSVRVRVGDTHTLSRAAFVSAHYFETLGTPLGQGRLLHAADHHATAAPVAVVSDHLWNERFSASPDLAGQSIEVDDRTYTVVGVAPPRFSGIQPVDVGESPQSGIQVWVPLAQERTAGDDAWLDVFGRKAADVSLSDLENSLGPTSARIEAASPGRRAQARVIARSFGLDPSERPMTALLGILLFMAVPLCVMGIAVANVINLQLARTGEQTRMVVVRLSLGATRRQAMRWLVWETAILAGVATLLGFGLTQVATSLGAPLLPFDLSLNTTVIVATLVFTTAVLIVSTWIPTRVTMRGLTLTSVSTTTPKHWRLRHGLVVAQVAVSVALVLVAALSARSISAVVHTTPPDADRVWLTRILVPDGLSTADRDEIISRLIADLQVRPEFSAVGTSSAAGLGQTLRYWVADDDPTASRTATGAAVTPGWFGAMGVTPLAGRIFSGTDTAVAVVSEMMALRLAPSATDVIGRPLRVQPDANAAPYMVEIVGVVADPVRNADGSARASLYLAAPTHGLTLVTRQRTTAPLVAALQRWARDVNTRLHLVPMSTLTQAVAGQAGEGVLVGATFGGIGALAAVLAFLGLVAIMSFMVNVRARELAIRGALGARPVDQVRLVLRLSTRLVGMGAATGVAIGVALAIAMRSQLVGVSALDPLSVLTTVTLFAIIGTLAAVVPAARAAATNPAILLRSS
jgi:predicted permease